MEGMNWLLYNFHREKNVILADEMGLGKTIQVIAALTALIKEKPKCWPFLIVVPNSTCPNWRREIKQWAPSLRVVTYYGSREARETAMKYELFPDGRSELAAHIVVTSYEAPVDDNSRAFFRKTKWAGLIVDEGQRLKNDKNLLYGALTALKIPFRVLLTGTPLQNNKKELFTLLQFLDSDINATTLDEKYEELTNENLPELHDLIRPYFLRRTKAMVLKFLPPMAQVIIPVTMSTVQKKLYKSILSKSPELLRSMLKFLPPMAQVIIPVTMSTVQKKLYKSILSKSPELLRSVFGKDQAQLKPSERGSLNNILMQLRKCLCHPFVYSEAIEERSNNRAVLHRNLVDASSKLQLLEIMLQKLQERGHRVLIFSQFLKQLDIIEDFLDGLGLQFQRLDGTIGTLEKQKRIDAFNAPNSPLFAFLLSTRAGGVGINLATADTVIIMDPDFNPHQDLQALSRAHRIGQKNKVLVFQLMTKDSAEEKIVQIGRKKMALDHALIETMDEDDDAGVDLQTILQHGATALFEDNDQNDIRYDSASVDKLLDRTQMETTNTGDDKSAESQFSYARIWANDSGALQDDVGDPDSEEPTPNTDFWEKILREREAEAAREELAKQKQFGRGKRARQVRYPDLSHKPPSDNNSQQVIGGYTDVVNEELTPRKFKKLRVMGESDGEFTRHSTEAEEEESDDAGYVDPIELAAAKARSGGRGMKQTSPASKSPAKSLPPKNEKKASTTPKKFPKQVVQANATLKKTARQTQPPKKAVKPDQPPKGPVKPGRLPKNSVKPDQPLKKAVKPDQPPKVLVKLGRPPKAAVKPDQPLEKAAKLGQPPKKAVKPDPAPRSPIVEKLTIASSGSASAGNSVLLDKKRDAAQGAPRKPKAVATAGRAPSNASQAHALLSETVPRKQAPNKRHTSVRVVTVAPKVLEPQANPLGDAISGKSQSQAKSVSKVVQQTTPMSNAVTAKRPRSVEPIDEFQRAKIVRDVPNMSDDPDFMRTFGNIAVHNRQCLACDSIHAVGQCPSKRSGAEHCGLCGLAHYGFIQSGSGAACPQFSSETQVRLMLDALKMSTEPRHIIEPARDYLRGVIGNLVRKKKKEIELQEARSRPILPPPRPGSTQTQWRVNPQVPTTVGEGLPAYDTVCASPTHWFRAGTPRSQFPRGAGAYGRTEQHYRLGIPRYAMIRTQIKPRVGNGVYGAGRVRGGRPALNQPFDGRPSQDPWLVNKSAVASNAGLYKDHIPYPRQTPSAPPASPADTPRMIITDRHLQSATGYALCRGNGRYTRLIAVDELPPLQGPGVNQGADGLIILPTPLNPTPLGPLSFHAPNPFPLTPPSTSGKPTSLYGPLPPVSTPSRPSRGPRKDKVYCDKWVHEGVCAFSQQGCRYKHEMPLDVATQHALGLFQGLPMWYKKENSVELRTPRGDEKANGEGATGTGSLRIGLPPPTALPSWRPGPDQSRSGGAVHRKPVAATGENGFSTAATVAKLSGPAPPRRNEFGSIARPVAQRSAMKSAVPGSTPGLESSIYAPAVLNPGAGSYASDSQSQTPNPFAKQHPWVVGPSMRAQTVAAAAATSMGDGGNTAAGSSDESGEAGGETSEQGANPYELLSAFEGRE
ncbi:hypothetical protein V498_04047 [Pseudogymnoascus sp. VKM F-4517 (FW-2822)]|nr:hypothetical protein V498_04047 [Pseudogymnoascus sp. VKM F-4517 (FW-2822)]